MKALPWSYIARNLWVRRVTTLLTAGGMALVVYVFATVLMMSEGIRATLVATGQPDNVMVLRKGAGAEIILLDNLPTPDIVEAVKRCRGRAKTEISGGVTLPRMRELAATGADYISVGGLTHSAPAVDLSFEIEPA